MINKTSGGKFMINKTPILQTCQCLVSEGWREVLIKRATYDIESYSNKEIYVLRLEVLVRDDNDIKGIIKSVYYDSARIREIATDLCEITGKSADEISADDFKDVHCCAYIVQRTSKAGRLYNHIDWFLSFEDYDELILNKSQNDENSQESAVVVPEDSTNTVQTTETKDTQVDKVNISSDCPKSQNDCDNEDEQEFEFDFSDDDDDEDEEDDEEYFNFFDEED